MTYTEDNIVGLVVTRGGVARYRITHVYKHSRTIAIKQKGSNRVNNDFCLDKALKYLEIGRWAVVSKEKVLEQVYQIY